MLEELNNLFIVLKEKSLELIPQLLISLLVLAIGYLLARLIKILIMRLMDYFSRLIKLRFENINLNQSSTFIGKVFFWLVMLSTFLLISDILKLTFVTSALGIILKYSPNVIAAILIIFIATFAGKFIANSISTFSTQVGFAYGNTLGRIAQYLILLAAIIIAIDQIGIEVNFIIDLMNIILATGLFGAAFAFALGAKTSISNILGTFYVRKIYKEGDLIKIGEIEGRISRIEATFVLLDTDSGQHIIPAKEFNETKSFLIKKK